jgi:hypothetical protein
MNSSKLHDDLSEIRTIMERSTKFLSLSPWSAIMAGIYALTGAAIAFQMMDSTAVQKKEILGVSDAIPLLFLAGSVFFAAAITALAVNYSKAKKAGQSLWNAPARRAFVNFSIPMAAGGVFALTLFLHGYYGLIAPSTLIFYGLALINTGNFTFGDIRSLGIWQLALGLVASIFPSYGLLFWALGFGILHLVYGAVLYWKYERKPRHQP